MILNTIFWENVVSAWISIQTTAEKEQVKLFAEKLVKQEEESKNNKVKSIYDELFGEEDDL